MIKFSAMMQVYMLMKSQATVTKKNKAKQTLKNFTFSKMN